MLTEYPSNMTQLGIEEEGEGMKRAWWLLGAAFALVAAACGGEATPETVIVTSIVEVPGATETSIVTETVIVTSEPIEVMASWGGAEQAGFQQVLNAFTAATGIPVVYISERDLPTVLPTRVAGGNPPDIALVPRPGLIGQFVSDGVLVPLASLVDMSNVEANYAPGVIQLGTFEGEFYALLTASNSKSTFWYKPPSFTEQDFAIPETMDDLLAILDAYVAAGKTPLSIGGLDGWTLTDWFENIYVRVAGPDAYNKLFVTHEVSWTDASVVTTMEIFRDIITPTGEKLAGGASGTTSTGFIDAWNIVLSGGAEMYYEGGFMGNFARDNFPDLVPGEDYSFFPFPEIDSQYGKPVVGGGDFLVAFNDRPETAAFAEFMASPEASAVWAGAELGNRITPNRGVSMDAHSETLTQLEAAAIQAADIFVFDGSDLAPPAVGGDAMFTQLQNFVANPDDIQSVLEALETAAAGAY
jgi:ABC-type glycerol-3-phosphate transport system substrate-binding protein